MPRESAENTSRVERIRRMLEEDEDDKTLFSDELVSTAPWDRLRKAGTRPNEAFDAIEKALTDARIIVTDIVENCDTVVVRWRLRGKWSGELPQLRIRPTGAAIDITGTNTYKFVGSKIVSKTGEFDVAGLHSDACERVNPAEARVNPAQCVEALNILAGQRIR